MNRTRTSGSAAVSQFQLIGGIRHDAGDCLAAVEPGGAVQQRKGALYIVAEPAGDPAVGGEACRLAVATLAHEYYADPSPSITTSLTQALTKANTGLLQYNRQVFATQDPPAGLPRKIRVGLSAAVVRPGQLYLCQLKPGLMLWTHQGVVVPFPRPAHWAPVAPVPNGDGELVGSFYPAPALGTMPIVEADFAFRRFDAGDLLVLCSSNLGDLLDEALLEKALPGRAAPEVAEYLHDLAHQAGLPEAHALVVEMAAAVAPRRGAGVAIPPAPDWVPEPRAAARPLPAITAPLPEDFDEAAPPAAPAHTAAVAPVEAESGPEETYAPPYAPDVPAEAGPPQPGVWDRARSFGRKAGPVVGSAGKATLGAAGTVGKATLGAAGNVLGATLPESVRQHGAAGMLDPEGELLEEDEEAELGPDEEYVPDEPQGAGGGIVDFDAPGRGAVPAATATFPWLRVVIPIAVVLLLAILVFAVQQILAGQQSARIDALLNQAQQDVQDAQVGAPADQRKHLLDANDLVQQALGIDAQSAPAQRLAGHIQDELDTINGVTRLTGLSLLFDFGAAPASIAATPTADSAGLGAVGTATLTVTGTLAPILPAPAAGDYLSQVVVQGDDAFLLDRGNGRIYRYSISGHRYTTLLAPGMDVPQSGTAGQSARVSSLLFLTWRPTAEGGDLAAIDDANVAYIWTPSTGAWEAYALGGADSLDRPSDLGAYDGNLYVLQSKTGQVEKWAAGAYTQPPVDWASVDASSRLRAQNPVAMTIDGNIYLLLGDGQVLTLTAGDIQSTVVPSVWPPIASPLALFTGENAASLYLVEAADKRIIRIDKTTGTVQTQLKAPVDTTAFDGLRNVYVDEAAGKIYVLSARKLYVAPLPPAPPGPGTPAPVSDTPAPVSDTPAPGITPTTTP